MELKCGKVTIATILAVLIMFTNNAFAFGYSNEFSERLFDFKNVAAREQKNACIGNPVTPECAVRTYERCFRERNVDLCKSVGVIGIRFKQGSPATANDIQNSRQRDYYKVLNSEDLLIPARKEFNWLPKGAVFIEIQSVYCTKGKKTCLIKDDELVAANVSPFITYYVTYPVNDLWHIQRWNTENDGMECWEVGVVDDPACKYLMSPDEDKALLSILRK